MARDFNGSSQYLYASGAAATSMPITLACWLRPDSSTATGFVMGVLRSGSNGFYALNAAGATAGDPIQAHHQSDAGGNAFANSSTGYSTGTWQHGAVVFASTTSRAAYLNGTNKGTDTTSALAPTIANTSVGARYLSAVDRYFDGQVAWPAIWNVALSDDEIAQLAAGMWPWLVRPDALVAFWPMDMGGSPEISETGSTALTLSGTPTQTESPPLILPWDHQTLYAPTAAAYTLTAAQGSYTYTGQAATITAARQLAAAQGSYTLTGQAASLLAGRLVTASQGSYTLSGQSCGLIASRILALGQGAYVLSGQSATLSAGRLLTASQGGYTLSGQNAGLIASRVLVASQGSYTLSGQDADIRKGVTMTMAAGGYTLSGQNADLLRGAVLVASQGGYTLSGQDAGLTVAHVLTAAQGGYTLSGQDAGLYAGRTLAADYGTYALVGQDVTISEPFRVSPVTTALSSVVAPSAVRWSGPEHHASTALQCPSATAWAGSETTARSCVARSTARVRR